MQELGYVDDRKLLFEFRWHENQPELRAQQAADLVRRGVRVIVAVGPDAVADALRASRTTPIVMFYSADPILMGWVDNLARPGGNLTGLAWDAGAEYMGKVLEVVREALPSARRVAVLWNSNNPSHPPYLRVMTELGAGARVVVLSMPTAHLGDFEPAVTRAKQAQAEALVIFPDPLTVPFRDAIMTLVARHRLPLFVAGDSVFDGALASYGPYVGDQPERAAGYVDRILKGARAGELPIEQPTTYRLVISAKAARALGVTIPPSLMLRAHRVVE